MGDEDPGRYNGRCELAETAASALDAEGVARSEQSTLYQIDLRYAGQGYELRIPLDGIPTPVMRNGLEALVDRKNFRARRLLTSVEQLCT